MKIYTTIVGAMFGLLTMAMPSLASGEVVRWYPRPVHPVVVRQVVAPAHSRPSSTSGRGHAPIPTTAIITGGAAINPARDRSGGGSITAARIFLILGAAVTPAETHRGVHII